MILAWARDSGTLSSFSPTCPQCPQPLWEEGQMPTRLSLTDILPPLVDRREVESDGGLPGASGRHEFHPGGGIPQLWQSSPNVVP